MNQNQFLDLNSLKLFKKKLSKPVKGIAIVTGGCGRIGSVFTSLFLYHGISVIVLSKNKKNFLNYSSTLKPNLKKKLSWKKIDLKDPRSIEKIYNKIKNIDIKYLVNNAAENNRGEFYKYNYKVLNKELWGTFAGSMLLTEKVLNIMRKKKNGKIIFTGSLWGTRAPRSKIYKNLNNGPTAIVASGKAGIIQYSKFLSARESKFNIKINTLLPGWFPRKGKTENKSYINKIKETIPLNRIGRLEDLITAIDFLISNGSDYMTGQTITIDGGYSIY